ncbi:MAG: hypothetical protein ACXVA9_09130 [Bdellovibrionales bacterium]
MKMLVTVISSLLVGLSLASANFSPIHELQNFLVHKRRFFISAGVAVTGFIFLISGLLMSLVEWALQYDNQGFVVWSALFTVAAGLAIAGAASLLISRLIIPARVTTHPSMLAELAKQFNFPETLETLIKHFGEGASAAKTRAAPEPVIREQPVREEGFTPEPPLPKFRETAAPHQTTHH